ncbi:SRPBCC family protein [Mycolicibacterium aubagnense]|uniref:SRPBCC family protein n=1 Tax=Mycolicibacterium aubagnense TaxID=319707 RepID=UPI0013D35D47|nr:SRPBCC family protein [Mycolicibacterium aubagnense]WGI35033.1 SRPBCC family protein [Mycolicibacterium aubagnense]
MTGYRRQRQDTVQTLNGSISINASAEKVWELITTVNTIPEWYDAWDSVDPETADVRLQLGTTFRLISRRKGRDHTARCRVTDAQAPTRLQWEQSALHVPTMLVTFLVIADGNLTGPTLLHHTRSWTTQ